MNRIVKQIIVVLIFLFILSVIIFAIYLNKRPVPSCFDGVKNQEEEEIDCGGPCQSCEIAALSDLEVLWTEAIYTQDSFYDLGARVKNLNQNYGSGQVIYNFKLYDSNDNFINQIEGATYILPNQSKYLIVNKVESSRPIVRIELFLNPIKWQKLKDYQPPQLVISQKKYSPSGVSDFSQASAVVINKTDFDFDKIDIDILLFNSEQKLVGLNATEIKTLLSGQERHFTAAWFREIKDEVVSVEIEAETNLFNLDNYMKRHGLPEKFMEY